MFRQIFLVLFLLLFGCFQSWSQGSAVSSGPSKSSANENTFGEFLKPEDNKIKGVLTKLAVVQESDKVTLNNMESVFLVAVDGMMLAVAELGVIDSSSGNKNEEVVLAKYIETSGTGWGKEAVQNKDKWEAQATKKEKTKKNKGSQTQIKSFAAVATKENAIYHITVSHDFFENALKGPEGTDPSAKWQVRLVEGTVTNSEGSNGKKEIKLESSIISVSTDKSKLVELKTEPDKPTPSDGFAFVTDDNNIIFVMKGKAKQDNDKNVTAVFQLENGTAGKTIKLLHVENIVSCYPFFFEWGKKLFMTPTLCPGKDSHNVKMFDKTNTFINSSESIAHLRDFLKDKKYFTMANINEVKKNVLLFTQQASVAGAKQNVYLWMSDGSHVSNVGTIVDDIDGESTFYGSILYTSDELFVLHQTYKTSALPKENTFSLTRLTDKLNSIKTTLKAWNENDKQIKDLYKEIDSATNSWLTDGLVGFLSVTKKDRDEEWTNVYHNFDTITIHANGEKKQIINNGFKFSGEAAGAKWLVGSENKDQPYNFTDFGFTLVATVIVGSGTNKNENSILGVGLKDKCVGLWCNTDGKWGVSGVDGRTQIQPSTVECKHDKTYYVAVILNNNSKLIVYVNGQKLSNSNNNAIQVTVSGGTEHFYFGAESDKTTDATITNVLLYNRPFTTEEAVTLKPKQNTETTIQEISQGNGSTLPQNNGSTEQIDNSLKTSAEQTVKNGKEEDAYSSPPPTTEDSAVRVGVVGLLCFMLFGVLTLLGRYVY